MDCPGSFSCSEFLLKVLSILVCHSHSSPVRDELKNGELLMYWLFSYTIRFISTSGRNPVVHPSILCSLTQMVSVGKNMTCNSMGVRFGGKNVSEGTVTGIVASYWGLLTTSCSTRRGADAWKRNLNYTSERLFQSNWKISDQKVVAIFVVLFNLVQLLLPCTWIYMVTIYLFQWCAGKPHNPMINAGAIVLCSLINPSHSITDRVNFVSVPYSVT